MGEVIRFPMERVKRTKIELDYEYILRLINEESRRRYEMDNQKFKAFKSGYQKFLDKKEDDGIDR